MSRVLGSPLNRWSRFNRPRSSATRSSEDGASEVIDVILGPSALRGNLDRGHDIAIGRAPFCKSTLGEVKSRQTSYTNVTVCSVVSDALRLAAGLRSFALLVLERTPENETVAPHGLAYGCSIRHTCLGLPLVEGRLPPKTGVATAHVTAPSVELRAYWARQRHRGSISGRRRSSLGAINCSQGLRSLSRHEPTPDNLARTTQCWIEEVASFLLVPFGVPNSANWTLSRLPLCRLLNRRRASAARRTCRLPA
jgi:hypothetical protein